MLAIEKAIIHVTTNPNKDVYPDRNKRLVSFLQSFVGYDITEIKIRKDYLRLSHTLSTVIGEITDDYSTKYITIKDITDHK